MNMASTSFDKELSVARTGGWARLASISTGAFLLLLAILHLIKSDLSPTWRLISEYAIGRHGWVMAVAFLLLATSYAALAKALRVQVNSIGGRIGIGLLLVAAVGTVLAALGTTDPITATSDQLTTHGRVHGLGSMLGIPGILLAATLISRDLARNADWRAARTRLWITTGLAWASMAMLALSMGTYDGNFGPEVKVGWPNRMVILSYCLWVLATAAHATKLRGEEPKRFVDVPLSLRPAPARSRSDA